MIEAAAWLVTRERELLVSGADGDHAILRIDENGIRARHEVRVTEASAAVPVLEPRQDLAVVAERAVQAAGATGAKRHCGA